MNDRGTIRFPLTEPIPARLIERIAKYRLKQVAEERAAKPTKAARKRTSKKPSTRARRPSSAKRA